MWDLYVFIYLIFNVRQKIPLCIRCKCVAIEIVVYIYNLDGLRNAIFFYSEIKKINNNKSTISCLGSVR